MRSAQHPAGEPLDPRAQRTRALLRSAILALSAEKRLDLITMADIAERAEVNRATVYLHYKDREDLLLDATESGVAEIVAAAAACLRNRSTTAPSDVTPIHLVRLFDHVHQNRRLYGQLLAEDRSPRFATRLRQLLAQAWFLELAAGRPPADETELLVRANYLIGALLAVIGCWAGGDFDGKKGTESLTTDGGKMTTESIAQLTWSLIRDNL